MSTPTTSIEIVDAAIANARPRARPSKAWIRGELLVWLGFLGLALLVAGPLLGRDWLLLLDFPSGPPHFQEWSGR